MQRVFAIACTLSVLLGWTVGDLAASALSADAMACCARTHHACGGMQAPDDCCKTIRHSTALPSSTAASHHAVVLPPSSAVLFTAGAVPVRNFAAIATSVRPHDPPHLHAFALLI